MRPTRDEIEAMARAIWVQLRIGRKPEDWDEQPDDEKALAHLLAKAAAQALTDHRTRRSDRFGGPDE
jgi:hypothetical protein